MGNPTNPRGKGRRSRGAKMRQEQGLQMDPADLQQARETLGYVDGHMAGLMASAGATLGAEEGIDFDFDAHWAAKTEKARPRRVRIRGRLYNLPGSMPASVMALGMRREFRDPERALGALEAMTLTMEMLTAALGEAAMKQMLADGIEMEEFPDVLAYVMGSFDELGRVREAAAAGAAPDPGEAGGGQRPATSGT